MLLNNKPVSEWLTEDEQLLLRAALLNGNEAIDAWDEWSARVDTDKINYHSMRLIPLLHQNLTRLNQQEKIPAQLNGVRRYFWAYNQLTFNYVAPALKLLVENGIDVMVLKGGALVTAYYDSIGSRPMRDVDFLIKSEDANRAIDLIYSLPEWNIYSSLSASNSDQYISCANELHFISDNWQYNIDLHWNLTHRLLGNHCEQDLWDNAEKTSFLGVPVYIPCATDMLMHVCLHSLTFRHESEPYWVADVLTIMRKETIDWQRLERLSINFRYHLEVRTALEFINSFQPESSLSDFLQRTADYKPNIIEKLQFHIGISPNSSVSRLLYIWIRYYWYRSSHPGEKRFSFRRFFQITHFLDKDEKIIFYMLKRSFGSLVSGRKNVEPAAVNKGV